MRSSIWMLCTRERERARRFMRSWRHCRRAATRTPPTKLPRIFLRQLIATGLADEFDDARQAAHADVDRVGAVGVAADQEVFAVLEELFGADAGGGFGFVAEALQVALQEDVERLEVVDEV